MQKQYYSLNYNNNNEKQINIIPIIKDNDSNNNENIFYRPNVGGYKLFYNVCCQNF